MRLIVRPVRDAGGHGFDVYGGDGGPPVAYIRQPRIRLGQRVRPPYRIGLGPGDDQVVAVAGGSGPVGAFRVATPDGVGIGSIRSEKGRWELHQPQAPVVVGVGRGLAGAVRRADAEVISGLGLAIFLPYRIEFTADGHPACTIARSTGLRGHYTIDIGAPWLDRRLILGAVIALGRFN
jgi:hypothetical protein